MSDYRPASEALTRDAAAFRAGSFDDTGLPDEDQCYAAHPATGFGCIEPIGHEGLHRAMGTERLQRFGPGAVGS